MRKLPILYIVIPCYNEEIVLPLTSHIFRNKLEALINDKRISADSRILFVDDGSKDATWQMICALTQTCKFFTGISLSRNRGHQNAVLAGLMESMDKCDITISIDCDGQDDINAMDKMVEAYMAGAEIVYGVRSIRDTDRFFKRFTAETFYKLLSLLGAEVIFNHADYRLISSKVLHAFADFQEVNLYLRGLIPLVGFPSANVYYERNARIAGESHYPLSKMLALAFDGITSLSVRPIRLITTLGGIIAILSFFIGCWSIVARLCGNTVSGWASITAAVCFIGGIQLICLGIIGEYIGKIYLEVKHRPRYIIRERIGIISEKEGNQES